MRVRACELSLGDRSEFGPVVGKCDGGLNRDGVPTVLVSVAWGSAGGLQFDLLASQLVEVA
jgi:hypothetical protein